SWSSTTNWMKSRNSRTTTRSSSGTTRPRPKQFLLPWNPRRKSPLRRWAADPLVVQQVLRDVHVRVDEDHRAVFFPCPQRSGQSSFQSVPCAHEEADTRVLLRSE